MQRAVSGVGGTSPQALRTTHECYGSLKGEN